MFDATGGKIMEGTAEDYQRPKTGQNEGACRACLYMYPNFAASLSAFPFHNTLTPPPVCPPSPS